MADDEDIEAGEDEGAPPEALSILQADRSGNNDNRRWRYAVRDVDALDYAGPGVWKQIGPAPLLVGGEQIHQGIGPDSGEVVDIAIDPRGGPERTIYIATGSGGVWKSTDDGASWRALTDHLPAMSIGAIALDPGDAEIVYVGTGNLFEGSRGMPKSAGLLKSTDGGRSWARLGGSPGRPPRPITAAVNVAGGVLVTVAGHGYVTFDRVATIGLPDLVGAAGAGTVTRKDNNQLRINGLQLKKPYGGAGATLYDAREAPFLSDRGIVRMVCPAPSTLLVATQTGLYLSRDGGRNFGANAPGFDDGRPIRNGLISALEIDEGWTGAARVTAATAAKPIVLTAARHGFQTGDRVFVGGVDPNKAANGGWLVDRVDADRFSLRDSDGTGAGAGPTLGFAVGPAHPATKPVQAASNPAGGQPIVITSPAHGFITGDIVAISSVGGNTAANRSWSIRVLSADTFALVGSHANGAHVANTGTIDGPTHAAPLAITAAVKSGPNITATVTGHPFVTGDRVTVSGLPGVTAPNNSATVRVLDANRFVLNKLSMNAPYGGAGATVTGPSDAWNTAYFVSAGRVFESTAANPDRGLFRLTITSTGQVVISDNLLAHPGGVGSFGRVAFSQSRLPRTRTLYACVQDNESTSSSTPVFVGLFRSNDFGATWTRLNALAQRANTDGAGQTYYDLTLGVDPQNSQLVYAGFQQLWRSTDGGVTWPTAMPVTHGGVDGLSNGLAPSYTLLHWDHHELVFPPPTRWPAGAGPTPLYLGTDGGIARGGDTGGVMNFTHLNEGIATSLIRGMDIGRGAGKNAATFAGMQDTGTAGHRAGDAGTAWTAGLDGDGGCVAVDPFDPNIVFGFDGTYLIRTTNGGQRWFFADLAFPPRVVSVHNENSVRVVTSGHTFANNDTVTMAGVTGGGGIANGASQITVINANEFSLNGKNGTAVAAFGPFPMVTGARYLSQATITGATLAAPIVIDTDKPHGCANGDRVRIDGVEGNLAANNSAAVPTWTVTVISPTRLSLNASDGTRGSAYVAGTGRMRGPQVNGTVPIQGAEFATPIVVTAQGHGFMSGDTVTIAGVGGNLAANGAGLPIRVLDSNSFELVGRAGNGAFAGGPTVAGKTIARGLKGSKSNTRRRVALVPQAGAAAKTVFVSLDAVLWRSTDGGITFTKVKTFADPVTALHAPDATRLWVGTAGNPKQARTGRVFFSADNGAHFLGAAAHFVGDVGARGAIACIAEDPQVPGGKRVAVVTSGYSETATQRRTRHCFLTTTAGISVGGAAAWTEAGGTFNAAKGNLPDVPLLGAAWDNSHKPAPSELLVASDSGVLRLGPGNVWQRVGPNLPNVSCQAIAIDTSVPSPVIRVGTYGRSAWELTTPPGARLYVEADLGFGEVQTNATVKRRVVLHSVGGGPVSVSAIDGLAGMNMTLAPVPAGPLKFPINLASGERRVLEVSFKPTTTGSRDTFMTVSSNDPERPSILAKASGTGISAGKPRLGVRGFIEFGTVRTGAAARFPLEIRNFGTAPLKVTRVELHTTSSPRFTLPAPPALPLDLAPGDVLSVDVKLDVTADGPVLGAVIVEGSGQSAVVGLSGTGTTTAAGMVAALFDVLRLSDRTEVLV